MTLQYIPRKNAVPSEHEEQKKLFDYVRAMRPLRPELRMCFAVPNGGHRNVIVAAKLKAEGVERGTPDVFLDVARGGYHGLRIEMKRAKGGQLSPDQKQRLEDYKAEKYLAVVCKGADEAIKCIEMYLDMGVTSRC